MQIQRVDRWPGRVEIRCAELVEIGGVAIRPGFAFGRHILQHPGDAGDALAKEVSLDWRHCVARMCGRGLGRILLPEPPEHSWECDRRVLPRIENHGDALNRRFGGLKFCRTIRS